MTISNANDFYDIMVDGMCSQYLRNFCGSIAHAINACMAIYHMGDWYVVQKDMDAAQKKSFYADLADKNPQISYAGQIINCSKHADRSSRAVILRLQREEIVDPTHDTLFMMEFVIAEMPDGRIFDLREIVSKGHNYWKQQLGRS